MTDWPASQSALVSFMATQQPEYRDSRIAWMPKERNSSTVAGYKIGMPAETKA
ncbi:hypothetical protein [Blastococcus brunescens]|uniref:Uncharacterized protein n=1 Tax=Blastococcus brunescens TaxID=1564165 RepID=A0ABZ1AUL7_9ACTN|nr:hypothetical protein [Blastococcus sp. BMG 8361]WRL62277.1 hypothetical protein U6N30_19845 [Blastococcus sp. BMG 8361]